MLDVPLSRFDGCLGVPAFRQASGTPARIHLGGFEVPDRAVTLDLNTTLGTGAGWVVTKGNGRSERTSINESSYDCNAVGVAVFCDRTS